MEMGTRGLESIEAVVDDNPFSFKFAKFWTGNDVAFLSGLGIQVGGDVSSTHLRPIHFGKEETQMHGLHSNNASIGFF